MGELIFGLIDRGDLLTVAALLGFVFMARLHLKADEKRDKALELLQQSQPDLIEAVSTQAQVIETRLSVADRDAR